ncbi:NUDIX domain-containing protein [Acetivibrio straminisolvens]|jgi:ADP-ribose pyrophosphatase|uniref:NUDIX domain-containing protein n=1 Tax=Acetivibrio straminisolvens TaxID=253314 RepID=UPI00223E9FB9|nr:NUDIX hydrolase [Acetivibrio straminisolvens]
MNYEEKTISKKSVYSGNIISVESVNVLLPNGKEASRDVVLHPGASVVIPINDNNEIYMVRQYRKPVEKELLELPAGKLDKGEDPGVCAKRELKEETGLEADKIKHILSFYSAPGFTNEILHIYAAVGLHEGEACADEDEFISTKKVPVDKLVEMVLNHEITDAKSIIGIFLAEKIVKGEIKI